MYNIYLKDLLNVYNSILINGDIETILDNFCIDTRLLQKNDIFVGIPLERGEHSIRIEYTTPLLIEGMIVSLVSAAVFVITVIISRKTKNKK